MGDSATPPTPPAPATDARAQAPRVPGRAAASSTRQPPPQHVQRFNAGAGVGAGAGSAPRRGAGGDRAHARKRRRASSDRGFVRTLCRRELHGFRRKFQLRYAGAASYVRRLRRVGVMTGHRGCVNTVAWNPDATLLVSGSDDCRLLVWRYTGTSQVPELRTDVETGHTGNIFCGEVLPHTNNHTMVSCAADGEVRLHHLAPRHSSTIASHSGRAHRVALPPHLPTTVLSAGDDGRICRVDLREGGAGGGRLAATDVATVLTRVTTGRHHGRTSVGINALHFNPMQPHQFLAAGDDTVVRVFDLRRVGEAAAPVATYHPNEFRDGTAHVTSARFSQDGRNILASYNDDDVFLFDVDANDRMRVDGELGGGRDEVEGVRDGSAAGSDAHAGARAAGGVGKSDASGAGAGRSDDSAQAAGAGRSDDSAQAGSPQGGFSFIRRFSGHRNYRTVKGVAFMGPRDEFVISGSDEGNIFIWSTATGNVVNMLDGDGIGAVNSLAPHPFHLPVLATSGLERTVKFWAPGDCDTVNEEAVERARQRNSQRVQGSLDINSMIMSHMVESARAMGISELDAFTYRVLLARAVRHIMGGGSDSDSEANDDEPEVGGGSDGSSSSTSSSNSDHDNADGGGAGMDDSDEDVDAAMSS